MMGLMVLIVFGVYIAACVWAVKATKRWAESNSRRPWLWGGLAAFVMYNLVFWDLIPTLVMHKYYCETQAGFTIYKTPEEWVKENQGVMETLKQSLSPTRLDLKKPTKGVTWVNQRFYIYTERVDLMHSLNSTESKFYDAKKNELIAKSINYWRGKSGFGGTLDELRQALIFDWGSRQCNLNGSSPVDIFDQYVYQFWKSGENK